MEQTAENRRLLIVEDERDLRLTLCQLVENMGIPYRAVASAEEALRCFYDDKFAAIVSDLSMPGMGGMRMVEELRKAKQGVPVVVLTALNDRETVRQALQLGAWDFVDKPFDLLRLRKVLHNALEAGERLHRVEMSELGVYRQPVQNVMQDRMMINLLRLSNYFMKKAA
jgi:DNA-binding NtrC family response regulator